MPDFTLKIKYVLSFRSKFNKMKLLVIILFLSCTLFATAQSCLNDTLKQQMIRDWERAKEYTREYLDAMPADKYGFRAADSIRSFAEQMLHLSLSDVGLVFFATGYKDPDVQKLFFKPNFEKTASIQNKDSVMYYVNRSYDFAINAVKNTDFNKLTEMVTQDMPGGRRSATRLAWLLKAFEHQTHHRAQCTIYLRVAGIRPPAEKLW